jgi:putative ABC transport system permease protein
MFWRVLWSSLKASRGRLTVALVALISGAAVSSALLDLQFDAERKFTHEFRTLGANVIVSPASVAARAGDEAPVFGGEELQTILAARAIAQAGKTGGVTAMAPFLFVVARAGEQTSLILAGTWLDEAPRLAPWWKVDGQWVASREDQKHCLVGRQVATQLSLAPGSPIELAHAGRKTELEVAGIVSTGGAEDSQVFVNLPVAQALAGVGERVGLVEISVNGSPEQVQNFVTRLAAQAPELEVRPLRQITQAEGQLLGRLRLLLLTTVVLVLALTGLCVLATMATLAMERRTDVGLMKALGGAMPRLVRLFLTEVGMLGAIGGLIGSLLGAVLAAWIGRQVFGTAISARFEVFPLTIALMMAVALAGAAPLRLLGRVRPAVVLRGE